MKEDKFCYGCRETKPLEMFCIYRRSKDGRQPWCKECSRKYRQTKAGKIASAKSSRKYNKTDKGRATRKKYIQSDKGKATRQLKEARERAKKTKNAT